MSNLGVEMSIHDLPKFSTADFNPDKYVRDLSQKCVGGQELQRQRKQIQLYGSDISVTLKKNVYQNYNQFIETAKEISHLESEMYQLSHLLSEQHSLFSSLANTSVLLDENKVSDFKGAKENPAVQEEDVRRQKIAEILEKVEGCADVLEVDGRILLHEGDLIELDSVENTALQRLRGYLFNDGFMLTTWVSERRGPMRYKFQVMYDLGSLAVVNVRDWGLVKHAFKLLAFPDTRMFQCAKGSIKKEWMEIFESAKKARLMKDRVKPESIAESRSVSLESPPTSQASEDASDDDHQHPDWLMEVPEELEVLVAQRHFEAAYELLVRTVEYVEQARRSARRPDPVLADIQRKVEARHRHLADVLTKELDCSTGKSLHGGLRASRRSIRLLNLLGRSRRACELFLHMCSVSLKMQCRRVKKEGSAAVYMRHLAATVFTSLCHMTEEFLRAFPDSPDCTSAFIVWSSSELGIFTSHFVKQVFVPQTSLGTVTECVLTARNQCERLSHYGIDLCYQLDGALRNPLAKALKDARDKLIEAIKLRASEEKWIPHNFKTKQALNRCLQEYAEMGVSMDNLVTGGCWLQLSTSAVFFIKLYLNFVENCLKLQTDELLSIINEILYDVFDVQLKHLEHAYKEETQSDTRQFIENNHKFLVGQLLSAAERKYTLAIGRECPALEKIRSRNITPKKTISKQKYTGEFI